jgi:hypothetical protein
MSVSKISNMIHNNIKSTNSESFHVVYDKDLFSSDFKKDFRVMISGSYFSLKRWHRNFKKNLSVRE